MTTLLLVSPNANGILLSINYFKALWALLSLLANSASLSSLLPFVLKPSRHTAEQTNQLQLWVVCVAYPVHVP